MAEEEPGIATPELMRIAAAKLRGHIAYYGVTDNSEGIHRFAYEVRRLLFNWLNRHGKRGIHELGEIPQAFGEVPFASPEDNGEPVRFEVKVTMKSRERR